MDFVWPKVSIPLPFHVQSSLISTLFLIVTMDYHTLMIHLTEPDQKYKGGMQHTMIQLQDLDLIVGTHFIPL